MVKVKNDKCFMRSAPFSLSIMDTFSPKCVSWQMYFLPQFSTPRGPLLDSKLSAQQVAALFWSSFSFSQQYPGPLSIENTQTFQALNTSVANIPYPGHPKDL